MSDAEVYNNTVFNEVGAAVDFVGEEGPGFVFRNNIFVSGTRLIAGGAHKARFEGNAYWTPGGSPFDIDGYSSLEAWSRATGQERIDDRIAGIWGDPGFLDPGSADCTNPRLMADVKAYSLQKGSPCIATGIPVANNGGRDLCGAEVSPTVKPSIGACQH